MNQFPHEFEALLSRTGRKVLAGTHTASGALLREGFFASAAFLEPKLLAGCRKLLARTFEASLVEISRPLPPPTSSAQSYEDSLPKVGRLLSVPITGLEMFVMRRLAKEIGLMQMLESESFRRFSEVLAGVSLGPLAAAQVLCNRRGDYAGPHTDNHPNEPGAQHGYVDVHFSFVTPGVRAQFIVHQRDGHLSAMAPIAIDGTVTAYRLPLWHYTTPLQTRSLADRRWLVLGSFHYASS
ncbi:MAG: hypothetical protein Q8N23_24075 [Archangium sp.]|nr:hypothetical protein [Archangium sp.]MDP3574014.1 hypothetical protein [Archangium sp.]